MESTTESTDRKHLERCLELAQEAALLDEVPVGAVLVDNVTGEVLAEAHNRRERSQSPIAHAEIAVIEEACKKRGSWRLSDCTLYSSLEPCVMCSGVIIQARIPKAVYSASDEKGGGQSLFGLLTCDKLNHQLELSEGTLAEESKQVLKSFFRQKRQK